MLYVEQTDSWTQHQNPRLSIVLNLLPDFDTESHVRYRMTLANGINGEGMISFSAVFDSGAVQDFGVAFVNLPDSYWAAASCSGSGDVTSLKVFYISGPEGKSCCSHIKQFKWITVSARQMSFSVIQTELAN